jgi:hypothetical protein
MRTEVVSDVAGLWEAWVDLDTGETRTLYVLGNVGTGTSRTTPVLLKKWVQGAAPSHLILEVMPILGTGGSRQAEVCYAEPVKDISQYQQISICSGEDIIARIQNIEVVF